MKYSFEDYLNINLFDLCGYGCVNFVCSKKSTYHSCKECMIRNFDNCILDLLSDRIKINICDVCRDSLKCDRKKYNDK